MGGRAVIAALGTLLGSGMIAATARGTDYPVSYSMPAAVVASAANASGSAPGANDFLCKPSRVHPDPVVLVHGVLGNRSMTWDTIAPLLADNGFCVFALTYGADPKDPSLGGLAPMEQGAIQLRKFVHRVLVATGAAKVDVVGHSEGTVMPRYWMEFLGGVRKVNRYVMLTPIWHGTNIAAAGTLSSSGQALHPGGPALFWGEFTSVTSCGYCSEVITGSPFMTKLNAHGMALPGVTYTNILTRYDELVWPYTSGLLEGPGVRNIVLQSQCVVDLTDHETVTFDPVAAQDVLNALDPVHAKPVPCAPVLPGIGAPLPPAGIGLRGYAYAPPATRRWSLTISPRIVRPSRRTLFTVFLTMRVGAARSRVAGGLILFAGKRTHTDHAGRARIITALRQQGGRYTAVAVLGARHVATVIVRVR